MNEIVVLILFLIAFVSTFSVEIEGAINSFKSMLGKSIDDFSANPDSAKNRLTITGIFGLSVIFLLITGFLAVEYVVITCIFCTLLEVVRGIIKWIAKGLTAIIMYIIRKVKGKQE